MARTDSKATKASAADTAVSAPSEAPQLTAANERAPVEPMALQAKLDRAEEMAGQLYKLAEAAQAAVDVLRPKLAAAEEEIERLKRDREAVAAELYRQSSAREIAEGSQLKLARNCDVLAGEVFRAARDRDRVAGERAAGLATLIDSTFDPLFWQPARLGARSAWWTHVPFAHWLVRAAAPSVLVELGTHTGVSYSAFCHAVVEAGLPTRCHAVDTWRGDRHAGEYGEEVYEDFRRFHDQYYGKFSTLLRCTFDEARDRFADGSVDLLHIDGLHTYKSVYHDFEYWRPKLSAQGIVLFHDTNVRDGDFGVWRLWEELRGLYPSFEFLHGHGLGMLALGENAPEAVLALCRLIEPAAVTTLRARFALIGERWSQIERLEDATSAATRAQAEAQELRVTVASLEAELTRLETMAADRAMATEMAETAAAMKAGELKRVRAEIAARAARSRRGAVRLPEWLRPRGLGAPIAASGDIGKPTEALYARPRPVYKLDDCHFYHTMELPGFGVVQGDWDLREAIDGFFAAQDLVGKRVLEIGPASGYVTFEMERRGASVVSIEVPDDPGWDFVPQRASVLGPVYGPRREIMRRLKNSYWFAHAVINSQARLCYGDVYHLPDALGDFDIAVMANVLLHAHSPSLIVEQCAKRSRSVMIVDMLHPELEGQPVCRLVPSAENQIWDTWWQFSTDFFVQFLGVLGFGGITKTTHVHKYKGVEPNTFFTLVAERH